LILAVKGLGGFHLAVNPHDDAAVRRLRLRKGRSEKPFALMARDLETVFRYCKITPEEEQALKHRTRPIVLLEAGDGHGLAPSVAPFRQPEEGSLTSFGMTKGGFGMPQLGFMLAYTPVHFLLLRGKFDALVMTSANLSEEPIAIGNDEAYERLGAIADYFLVHNRDILQRCDDSVVRVRDGAMTPIRRSRGFVPHPVDMPISAPKTILACGAEMKNTIGLARGDEVFLSQHIGDLDNPSAYGFFEQSIRHLQTILEIEPDVIVYDMHPEYVSTKWALAQKNFRLIAVQHHHAHLAAVMAENGVTDRTIGIILDGTGYGTDGTIWGGEVLIGDLAGFDRFAWLRPFSLPGGAAAIKHPWRTAYAMVQEALCTGSGDHAFRKDMPTARSKGRSGGPERRTVGSIPNWVEETLLPFETMQERETFKKVLRRRINTPRTSSCGRLFDGVSAILGLCREVTYEAQAAIALEMTADPDETWSFLTEEPIGRGPLDWTPILRGILGDIEMGTPVSVIATRFHRTLADLFVSAALQAREETGIASVGLSGGVFQNGLLFADIGAKLRREGFDVITHRLVPTNDGGIAYGQAAVAAWRLAKDVREMTNGTIIIT
ncbi:MAG: carbamoyltransferase HypF, partial [Rhodothermales bacterium]